MNKPTDFFFVSVLDGKWTNQLIFSLFQLEMENDDVIEVYQEQLGGR